MRALPARAQEPRQFSRAETPVHPRDDDTADEKEEERARQ